MSQKIDSAGTYKGTVVESKFDFSTNGAPQAVIKLHATQRYVEDAALMAHFKITEPAWVDWTQYDETIIGYFVMFKVGAEVYTNETKTKNYDQLKLALGWDGTDFEPLNEGTFVDKEVLFRVEQREYNYKMRFDVTWIDDPDAPPMRNLQPTNPTIVKAASAKLRFGKPATKSAVAAKPGEKPSSPIPAVTVAPAATNTAVTAPTTSPKPISPSRVVPSRTVETCTKIEAWTDVSDPDKNNNADETTVGIVWNNTIDAVGGESTPDESITDAQWNEIRTKALAKLNEKQS